LAFPPPNALPQKKTRRFEADATGSEESRESRQRTDHIIGDNRADAPFVSGELNVCANAPISTAYTIASSKRLASSRQPLTI
jgi:hypothetical protein